MSISVIVIYDINLAFRPGCRNYVYRQINGGHPDNNYWFCLAIYSLLQVVNKHSLIHQNTTLFLTELKFPFIQTHIYMHVLKFHFLRGSTLPLKIRFHFFFINLYYDCHLIIELSMFILLIDLTFVSVLAKIS